MLIVVDSLNIDIINMATSRSAVSAASQSRRYAKLNNSRELLRELSASFDIQVSLITEPIQFFMVFERVFISSTRPADYVNMRYI